MPPEPLPWDRKDFFKERKHERSESLGPVARWRESSNHGTREFNRWGSGDFRKPPGHDKQGGWHLFSEDSGNGYGPPRSSTDKILEDESFRPSSFRGHGKYGRNGRESRGSFNQRDWRGHSWDPSNVSPSTPGGQQHDVNNDQRSVDDTLMYPSNTHSDFANTWGRSHLKDQPDKIGGVNGLGGVGQRCNGENSISSIDWKPLKWTRSGSLSSRGSGFSHSSSSKSMGASDSNETKSDLPPKNATSMQSPSGDAAACVTSSLPSEERTSRKKPRLGWGDGLAKFEKKNFEGSDASLIKGGAAVSTCNPEPTHSIGSSLVEKSPRVAGFSDCASPATPSSVACSSLSGGEDKSFCKAASIDNDISNICGSPGPSSQNQLEGSAFKLEKLDIFSIANWGSSFINLLQSDDTISLDCSFVRSTVISKLLMFKSEISKTLEVTESEIDLLENELKSLRSESGGGCSHSAASSAFLPVDNSGKHLQGHGTTSLLITRPAPVPIPSLGDTVAGKMPVCNGNLEEVNIDGKDENIDDSPKTATSRFLEKYSPAKEIWSPATAKSACCSGNLNAIESANIEECVVSGAGGEGNHSVTGDGNVLVKSEDVTSLFDDMNVRADEEDTFYDLILASNKESSSRASEVFDTLSSRGGYKIDGLGINKVPCPQIDQLIKEKIATKKHLLKFKERVITLKFKAFQHLWKEDLCFQSIKKCRSKPQKKFESGLRATQCVHQKYRSSIRSHFSSPGGTVSLVPSAEINYASMLLMESQVKLYRDTLKMPAMVLDKKDRMASRFISSNGLVEDPSALEKERAMINTWALEEREVFMDKLATLGKDFRKIATFLPHKTTADCIEFYYKNHKSDSFEKTRKKLDFRKQAKSCTGTYLVTAEKKWNLETNAASLDMLGAASVMAANMDNSIGNRQRYPGRLVVRRRTDFKTSRHDDTISESTSSYDIHGTERDTAAADVLAGICSSLSSEAMSACIKSSEWKCKKVDPVIKWHVTPNIPVDVDDETCSGESCGEMEPSDWTDEEKALLIQAVSLYGKDFAMISRCVRTRSRDQCKIFFSKARKCLELDLLQSSRRDVEIQASGEDANGSRSDSEGPCVLATGSGTCNDKLRSKADEDLPLAIEISDKADRVDNMNVQQTEHCSSGENNVLPQLDHKNINPMGAVVSNLCHEEDRLITALDGDCNSRSHASNKPESVNGQRSELVSVNAEIGRDQDVETGISVALPFLSSNGDEDPSKLDTTGESEVIAKVTPEDLRDEGQKKRNADAIAQSVVLDSNVDASLLVRDRCSDAIELDLRAKPCNVTSLHQDKDALSVANSVSPDSTAPASDKMLKQDTSSLTLDFQENRYKQYDKSVKRDSLSNGSELSQILTCNPLQVPTKNEMTENISGKVENLPNLDSGRATQSLGEGCYLKKCNNSNPHGPLELPLMSLKKIGQPLDQPKSHSRSSSDSERPSRNGNVKLFGQIILSHSSSLHKSKTGSNGKETGTKIDISSSRSKPNDHLNANGNPAFNEFDRNNFRGSENVHLTSNEFWDRSKIQTGFSSIPDSAVLLARHPAAFGGYSLSSSEVEQPLHPSCNEHNLNGVSFYQTDQGVKLESLPVGMKQQRMNVIAGNRGVLVGAPCTGVSDPVAAIKVHYVKAEQNGHMLREEESWTCTDDKGR